MVLLESPFSWNYWSCTPQIRSACLVLEKFPPFWYLVVIRIASQCSANLLSLYDVFRSRFLHKVTQFAKCMAHCALLATLLSPRGFLLASLSKSSFHWHSLIAEIVVSIRTWVAIRFLYGTPLFPSLILELSGILWSRCLLSRKLNSLFGGLFLGRYTEVTIDLCFNRYDTSRYSRSVGLNHLLALSLRKIDANSVFLPTGTRLKVK